MCLATIYLDKDNSILMENTSQIKVDGNRVELMDLFGIRKEVVATVKTIDLEKNVVILHED